MKKLLLSLLFVSLINQAHASLNLNEEKYTEEKEQYILYINPEFIKINAELFPLKVPSLRFTEKEQGVLVNKRTPYKIVENSKKLCNECQKGCDSWTKKLKSNNAVYCKVKISDQWRLKLFASSSAKQNCTITVNSYFQEETKVQKKNKKGSKKTNENSDNPLIKFLEKKGFKIPQHFFETKETFRQKTLEYSLNELKGLEKERNPLDISKLEKIHKKQTKRINEIKKSLKKYNEQDLKEDYAKSWLTHAETAIAIELLDSPFLIPRNTKLVIMDTKDPCFQCQYLLHWLANKLNITIECYSKKVFIGKCFADDNISTIKQQTRPEWKQFNTRKKDDEGKWLMFKFLPYPTKK